MKKLKYLVAVVLCIILAMFPVQASAASGGIKLNKSSVTLKLNGTKTVQLKAKVTGQSSKVTWKSSNSKVAAVNSSGKVTAKGTGKATITARANGKTAKCTVTVKKAYKILKKDNTYLIRYDSVRVSGSTWIIKGKIWPLRSRYSSYYQGTYQFRTNSKTKYIREDYSDTFTVSRNTFIKKYTGNLKRGNYLTVTLKNGIVTKFGSSCYEPEWWVS